MRFLARLMDDYYEEHGTSFFRRSILAFIFGTVVGAWSMWRMRRECSLTPQQMAWCALGIGAAVMLVAIFMNLSSALWSKGIFAKLCAIVLFMMGCVALLALICFGASQML